MQAGERLAQLSSGGKQRRDDFHQIGHVFDELNNAGFEAHRADDTTLGPKFRKQPADVVLDGDGLLLQKLPRRQIGRDAFGFSTS